MKSLLRSIAVSGNHNASQWITIISETAKNLTLFFPLLLLLMSRHALHTFFGWSFVPVDIFLIKFSLMLQYSSRKGETFRSDMLTFQHLDPQNKPLRGNQHLWFVPQAVTEVSRKFQHPGESDSLTSLLA